MEHIDGITIGLTLVVLNLAIGLGCAFPLAQFLDERREGKPGLIKLAAMFVGVYFVECFALMLGMGIPVLNIPLAFVWGVLLGRWFRGRVAPQDALRKSLWLSLYTGLPAVSFIIVPMFAGARGWDIWSAVDGRRFGIPDFLPWPVRTIAGFYAACALGAVISKCAITIGTVRFVLRGTFQSEAKLG